MNKIGWAGLAVVAVVLSMSLAAGAEQKVRVSANLPGIKAVVALGGEDQPVYPPEDPGRVAESGEGYDREGQNENPALDESGEAGDSGEDEAQAFVATQEETPRPSPPSRRGYIWVRPYRLPSGLWVPGFWRPRVMAGFKWVNGIWNVKAEAYVPGYWRPVRVVKKGYIWVPGYWFAGRWVPGLWRPAKRPGFVWVDGRWSRNGEWMAGQWRPARVPAGRVWVSGRWVGRAWVAGHWRPTERKGYVWVAGHHNRQGQWVPGRWKSTGPVKREMRRQNRRNHR